MEVVGVEGVVVTWGGEVRCQVLDIYGAVSVRTALRMLYFALLTRICQMAEVLHQVEGGFVPIGTNELFLDFDIRRPPLVGDIVQC